MKFAFADPPYLGQGKKHYGLLHPDASDCDTLEWHRALIARLVADYPDGWALSASSPSLAQLIPMCPPGVRIAAWVKPFAVFKPNVNPAYAWEPVIFIGGRKRERYDAKVRDWHSENIAMRKGVPGAKPKNFGPWIASLLNVTPEDSVDDLFPGTGEMIFTQPDGKP